MKTKVYSAYAEVDGSDCSYYQLYFVVPELDFVFWYDGETVKTDDASSYSHEFAEATPERRTYRMQSLEDLEVPDELVTQLREYQTSQKALAEKVEGLNEQRRGNDD